MEWAWDESNKSPRSNHRITRRHPTLKHDFIFYVLVLDAGSILLETAAQAIACLFTAMARRPIVGGNWKCNPDSFSKLDDLIKIMKLGLRPKVGFKVKSLRYPMAGEINGVWDGDALHGMATHSRIKQNLEIIQFHLVTSCSIRNECDTSGCDVFVCPSPLHVAYVASKVKDTRDSQPSCGVLHWNVSGSEKSNKTSCAWHHLLNTCSGEHPRVCPELWLQGLWRFHWRNRRGAIEGAPWSFIGWTLESSYWRVPVVST